jgi:hypothetical protein
MLLRTWPDRKPELPQNQLLVLFFAKENQLLVLILIQKYMSFSLWPFEVEVVNSQVVAPNLILISS